jgi:hypothetical protein
MMKTEKSTVQYERTIFTLCPVLDRLCKYIYCRRRTEELQLLHRSIYHRKWKTTETKPGKKLNFGICLNTEEETYTMRLSNNYNSIYNAAIQ